MQDDKYSEYLRELNDFAEENGVPIRVRSSWGKFTIEATNPTAIITTERGIFVHATSPDGRGEGVITVDQVNGNKILATLHSYKSVENKHEKFVIFEGRMRIERTYGLWDNNTKKAIVDFVVEENTKENVFS